MTIINHRYCYIKKQFGGSSNGTEDDKDNKKNFQLQEMIHSDESRRGALTERVIF